MAVEWLNELVPATGPLAIRAVLTLPDGRLCATDGCYAVVSAEKGSLPRPVNTYAVALAPIIDAPLEPSATMNHYALCGRVGPHELPAVGPCPECGGSGRVEHDCSCDICDAEYEDCNCDGEPVEVPLPKRTVEFFGHNYNARYLAHVLAVAPAAAEYTIGIGKHNCLHIIAPEWHAVFAPLSGSEL